METHSPNNGFTHHACIRKQQRAIPDVVTDWLLSCGDHQRAGRGAESYFFTKKSWRRFEAYLGAAARAFDRYRNIYVVVAGGAIVTVAYRY